VQLAAGWGDLQERKIGGQMLYSMAAPAPASAPAYKYGKRRRAGTVDRMRASVDSLSAPRSTTDFSVDGWGAGAGAPPEEEKLAPPALNGLLFMQSADGWFDFKPDVYAGATSSPQHWREAVSTALLAWLGGPPNLQALHTAMALLLMRTYYAAGDSSWRRAYRKAVLWLAGAVGRPGSDVESWLQATAGNPAVKRLVRA
jgi:hypothetical protein